MNQLKKQSGFVLPLIILIVAVLIIAGGILAWQYWGATKKSIPPSEETMQIKVYFHNSILQEEVCPGWPGTCPDGTYDCALVFPVMRSIPKTKAVAQAAVKELIKSPTNEEKEQGYYSGIVSEEKIASFKQEVDIDNPWGLGTIDSWGERVRLRSLKIEDGIAYVNFSKEVLAFGTITTSCGGEGFASPIKKTLKQFPSITDVEILIEGKKIYEFF